MEQWGVLRGDFVGVVSMPVLPCIADVERNTGVMERSIDVAEVVRVNKEGM